MQPYDRINRENRISAISDLAGGRSRNDVLDRVIQRQRRYPSLAEEQDYCQFCLTGNRYDVPHDEPTTRSVAKSILAGLLAFGMVGLVIMAFGMMQ